jgi:hypothetical protein
MKPIFVETEKQDTVITHKCSICSHTKRNKTAANDSIDAVLQIIALVHEKNT